MLQLSQGSHPAQQRLIFEELVAQSGQFAQPPCLYSTNGKRRHSLQVRTSPNNF